MLIPPLHEEQISNSFGRDADPFFDLIARNPFGVYLVDEDFKLVEVSLGAQKVFENVRPLHGHDFGDAIRIIWPEPFASEVVERFQDALATGQSYQAPSFSSLRADIEKEEAYDWRVERITLPDGKYGAVCYFYDLSERHRWEAALTASEERIRTLVDTIPALIFVTDPAGITTYASPSFDQYTGFSAEQILNVGWLGAIHPDDRERALASWAESQRLGTTHSDEYRFVDKVANHRWFLVRISPMRDAEGVTTQWVGSATDMQTVVVSRDALIKANDQLEERVAERTTELRTANVLLQVETARREVTMAALAQSQKLEALGQLTSGIAHDFNNIVAAISGGFTVIERRTDDPRIIEITRHGLKAAQRGAGLVKQLLAFAQNQVLAPKVVDLCELLREATPLLERAVVPHVALAIHCPDDIGTVRIDPIMLEAALINLAINASDAMPNGGTLRIEAQQIQPGHSDWPKEFSCDRAIAIKIEDNGQGISAAILERVTEPFFTTKGRGKGTGLGLAMVHGFSRQSGGAFRIESIAGEGTAATIYLPRLSDEYDAVGELEQVNLPVRSLAPDSVEGATLLVVDDDDDVRAVVCAHLEDLGYKTIAVSNGAAALVLIDARPDIDAVLTDVVMPGMNGVALAATLRGMHPTLPILFMTGHADRHLLAGEQVLDKPFTAEKLAEGILATLSSASPGAQFRETP